METFLLCLVHACMLANGYRVRTVATKLSPRSVLLNQKPNKTSKLKTVGKWLPSLSSYECIHDYVYALISHLLFISAVRVRSDLTAQNSDGPSRE